MNLFATNCILLINTDTFSLSLLHKDRRLINFFPKYIYIAFFYLKIAAINNNFWNKFLFLFQKNWLHFFYYIYSNHLSSVKEFQKNINPTCDVVQRECVDCVGFIAWLPHPSLEIGVNWMEVRIVWYSGMIAYGNIAR